MFPEQQNQPRQGYPPPQTPSAPQPMPPAMPQQAPNGQYEVLPPLPAGQNNGHSGHNPYEFIVTPNQKNHSRFNLFGGNSFFKQIALIVGGGLLLIIILAVIVNLAFPGGNTNKAKLTAIAQQQAEIMRVATLASQSASQQNVKNFLINVELSVTSSQSQILQYLASHGTKLGTKTLAAGQNNQTTTQLQNAQDNGTLDSTAVSTLATELSSYQGSLQSLYHATQSTSLKSVLSQNYQAAGLLQLQAKSTQ